MDGFRATVLTVGQGSGNLIEVYDDMELINLILIDFGSDDGNYRSCQEVNDLMKTRGNKAKEEGITKKDFYLDCLIISHQDQDHYNLMNNILTTVDMEIGYFYSFSKSLVSTSASYGKFYDNAVAAVQDKSHVLSFSSGSGLNADGSIMGFYKTGNPPDNFLQIYCLYANAFYDGGGRDLGFKRNTVSAVIGFCGKFSAADYYYGLFTADCTVFAMSLINAAILKIPGKRLKVMEIVTAPHHGSIVTSCDAPKKYDQTAVLEQFLTLLNANELCISAGAVSEHGHPHIGFMNAARKVQSARPDETVEEVYQSVNDKGHYPPYDSFTFIEEHNISSLCQNCITEIDDFPNDLQVRATGTSEKEWIKMLNKYAKSVAGYDDVYNEYGDNPPPWEENRVLVNSRKSVTVLPGRKYRET